MISPSWLPYLNYSKKFSGISLVVSVKCFNMNSWIVAILAVFMISTFLPNTTSGRPTPENTPVCSLADIKKRMRESCKELKTPVPGLYEHRQKRGLSDGRIMINEPVYYFRVKRDESVAEDVVKVVCCLPQLIPKYGKECINKYYRC